MTEMWKLLFGDIPVRGAFRAVVIGALLCACFFTIRDWKEGFEGKVSEEAASVRLTLATSIASNEAWRNASLEERVKLLRKVNIRLRRLYEQNGWQYEEVEP
jgi:hypothetical protein